MSVESERDRVFFPNILRIMTSQVVYILEKCNKLERFTERPEVIVLLPVKIIRLVQMKSNEVLVYAAHNDRRLCCSEGIGEVHWCVQEQNPNVR